VSATAAPATAVPRPTSTPRPTSAAAPRAPAAAAPTPAPALVKAPTPAPAVAPVTGVVPQSRDATPVRTQATVAPAPASVHAWQIVAGVLAALAVVALVVLRTVRQRRRAALHARYNRMRVERGQPPLTPKQIDFIGRRRGY
jgi:hypothetical protein